MTSVIPQDRHIRNIWSVSGLRKLVSSTHCALCHSGYGHQLDALNKEGNPRLYRTFFPVYQMAENIMKTVRYKISSENLISVSLLIYKQILSCRPLKKKKHKYMIQYYCRRCSCLQLPNHSRTHQPQHLLVIGIEFHRKLANENGNSTGVRVG